ncbi:hypothetical protein GCM10008967_01070 [Bacillus carboniphilus]|uniref:Uncharacterized protein n=1 Tax=Bacillus carboniphilus TaxID=86663 RepID=A0ABN0VQM6_9BACI
MDEKTLDSFIVRVQKIEDRQRVKVVHVQDGNEKIVGSLEEAYNWMQSILEQPKESRDLREYRDC